MRPLSKSAARQLGADSMVFAFPLLVSMAAMRLATNVATPTGGRAPINQFAHLTRFAEPDLKEIVGANADTLYSLAWLDLSEEPVIVHLPDTDERSFLMPVIDAWTNLVVCFGPRTVGTKGGDHALVGPDWDGELPDAVGRVDVPTNTARMIFHLHARNAGDLEPSRSLQQKTTLTPLSAFGSSFDPPAGDLDPQLESGLSPHASTLGLSASEVLGGLAVGMAANSPAPLDDPLLDRLAEIGLRPGDPFEWMDLDEETQDGLERGVSDGKGVVMQAPPAPKARDGWQMLHGELGSYGGDYPRRAQTANLTLGAPRREDASFPIALRDSDGNEIDGREHYVIRFAPGELPPVGALWSISLYDSDQLPVENAIDRYALGDRDEMRLDADGSLQIVIQHEPPNGANANWLPAPEGPFNLMLHLYWPCEEALEGRWTIPSVYRVGT